MGTISEKLTYLNETKGKIKDSINLTGAGITDQDTFRSYETKLKDGFVDIINNGVDTLYENFPKVVQTGEEPTLNGVYEAPMRVDLNGNTEQSILPSGYTQVDYIESTGNQYINTGINGDYKLSIKTKIVNLNTSGSMFGAMSGSGAGRQSHHFQITQTTISNWAGTGDSGCQTTLVSGTEAGKTYDIFCDVYNQKYYVDDVEVTGVFNSNDFDTGLNYYLFARNNSGTVDNFSKIRMYYFKMYIQDVLVRDFVPCYRNSDSAVGLYDLVNNVFYTNQGTGAFTYGSVAPTPDTPMDIRVVNGNNTINIHGKNLFDKSTITSGKRIDPVGVPYTDENYSLSDYITIKSNTTYTRNLTPSAYQSIAFYTNDKTFISRNTNYSTITTPSDAYYVRFSMENANVDTAQLEEGSTATTYEPYQNQDYEINLKSKNLLPNLKTGTITDGNVTFVVNEDKSITINCDGTGTSSDYAYLTLITDTIGKNTFTLPAGTYTRYGSTSGTNIDGILLQTRENNSVGTEIYSSAGTSVKTTTLSIDTIVYPRIRVSRNVALSNITIYPMIVSGEYTISTIPSYEPYYNYELCEIDKIRKSTGKNLFDKDNANMLLDDVSINGTTGAIADAEGFYTLKISCKPNTTYTISKVISSRFIVCYTNNATYTSGETFVEKVSNSSATNLTITTGQNAKSLYVFYSKLSEETTYSLQQILDSIQIEENPTATDYEPFGKDWYKKGYIGKVVLDGSEDWQVILNVDNSNLFRIDFTGYEKNQIIYCNYYKGLANQNNRQNFNIYLRNDSNPKLDILDNRFTTVEDFKTWLSNNPVTVYYPLSTPTIEILPEIALITELEDLKTAKSVEGQTNITQTNEELPFIINASALSKI